MFYYQVPVSGNYTFYIACDVECELWFSSRGMTAKHDLEHKENRGKMIVKMSGPYRVMSYVWDR